MTGVQTCALPICTVAPLADRPPEKGEVVLCKVAGAQYLHLVLAIKDGRLTGVKGLDVPVPVKRWLRLEVVAVLGPDAPRTWTLRLTPKGEPTQEIKGLPFRSPQFDHLGWLGFISNANEATEFYLDELDIRSTDGRR